jgi:acyl-lipid omega-6 desaturase (Delta-12 desaturase)
VQGGRRHGLPFANFGHGEAVAVRTIQLLAMVGPLPGFDVADNCLFDHCDHGALLMLFWGADTMPDCDKECKGISHTVLMLQFYTMSQNLRHKSRVFATASTARSLLELMLTVAGYVLSVAVVYVAYTNAWWVLYGLACLIASLFMVKVFTLFHDCTHGSMFNGERANRFVGRTLSLFLTVPFYSWKAEHDDHHSHVVDMERIDKGDVTLLTVAQYRSLPTWKRCGYRIFRHPLFMLLAAPFLYFFIKSRVPGIFTKKVIWSVILTNIVVAAIYLPLLWYFGFWTVVFVFVPAAYFGGILGVLLFYLQHDYPGAEWFETHNWEHEKAALAGSSLIILPAPLEWFSHAIGYHHIHHLNSKIPGYRLRECFNAVPEFQQVKPLTWTEVMESFRLKLWSYERAKLVTFTEMERVGR